MRGGAHRYHGYTPAELRAEAVRLRMAAMRRASHAHESARALAEMREGYGATFDEAAALLDPEEREALGLTQPGEAST